MGKKNKDSKKTKQKKAAAQIEKTVKKELKAARKQVLKGLICPCCKKKCSLSKPKCSKGKAIRKRKLTSAGL